MNTLLVPGMLAAMVAAWIPTEISFFTEVMSEASCALKAASTQVSQDFDRQHCLAEAAGKSGLLPDLIKWQSLADL